MSLSRGDRLGPYEIVSAIGAGGMGEVYRAHDTKLGRDVALKVLPADFALDADRLERFKREAQFLASLNHPNIAAIHGFEDSGDVHALVLELVEGETLAERIARGAIPFDEALPLARQICDALEAAHGHGVIHRDLKPANIKVRPDGTVKVLDFGLAKAGQSGGSGSQASGFDATLSPTMTSPGLMTGVGVVLGTAAYMAPEQAKGRLVDKRSDIWAFGCVLYEMLTGRRAFGGDDATDLIAAIVRGEPDWSALPPDVPAHMRTLLRGCLEKDRRRRIGDIAVAHFLLDDSAARAGDVPVAVPPAARRGRVVMIAVAGVVLGAVGALVTARLLSQPPPTRVSKFEIVSSNEQPFASPLGVNVAISPDGSAIVYHAQPAGVDQLMVRRINELDPRPIAGTTHSTNPFFSPDGTRVGFVSGGQIKTIALSGGPPSIVCDVQGQVQGATWVIDAIVFAQAGAGLFRVPAVGGRPENIAAPNVKEGETDYRWPDALPGGNAIIYTVFGSGGIRQARIAARRLDGSGAKILVEGGTNPHYVSSGHLIYATIPSAIAAVPFDLARLEVMGAPVPVQDGVVAKGNGAADYGIANDGTLVYLRGGATVFQTGRGFQWVGRDGKSLGPVASNVEGPRYPRLSPDGRRLAVTLGPSNQGNIWMIDVAGGAQPLELTFKAHNVTAIWRPDGRYLVFTSDRQGQRNLFGIPADGSALEPERLSPSPYEQTPLTWSSDGRWMLFMENAPKTGSDLFVLDMTGDKKSRAWLQTEFDEEEASFSPDGRWVSYVSNQTGRAEVWVRPFPGPGAPRRVSPEGGHEPVWSRSGKELFYQSGRKMMTVEVASSAPELQLKPPRVLFEGGFLPYDPNVPRTYDVAPDGRFLMIREDEQPASASFVVVQNWIEDLKRLVPSR
jgi:serine/threonine protein kinase/Tol biopolymer transport system component